VQGSVLHPRHRLPRLDPTLIARPRLDELIEGAVQHALTVVLAPAGYGKTNALGFWARRTGRSVAWLSLDRSDNHPARFVEHVLGSLEAALPAMGTRTRSALQSGAPVSETADLLIDDLSALAEPAVLVLDDFQLIVSSEVHATVNEILSRVSRSLRVVIASRVRPRLRIAHLRACRQLADVRSEDLAFTSDEVTAWLDGAFMLDLGKEEVDLLMERFEGWPAGLYLAALALERAEDRSEVLSTIGGGAAFVSEYLEEEVLSSFDPESRPVILRTGVPERLCAALCHSAAGSISASHFRAFARSNLFLVPLDPEERWFRYRRPFRDFLLSRLEQEEPGATFEVLRKTASWLADHGEVLEAVRAASSANDTPHAARILAGGWAHLLRSGETSSIRPLIKRLDRAELGQARTAVSWLEALFAALDGKDRAVVERHLSMVVRRDFGEVRPALIPDTRAAVAVVRASALFDDVAEQREAGLSLLRQWPDEPALVAVGGFAVAMSDYYLDRDREALRALVRFGDEVDPRHPTSSTNALALRALILARAGRLDEAAILADRAYRASRSDARRYAAAAGLSCSAMGVVLALQGDLVRAMPVLQRAVKLRGIHPGVHRADAQLALARALHLAADDAAARAVCEEVRVTLAGCRDPGALRSRLRELEALLGNDSTGEAHDALPSAAELRVLRLLASDLSGREIAGELFISHNTLKTHVRALYRKLGAASREAAVRRARERRLI
jgi:LuxR family transcriptional regulator, maltose regulon positive regulatory protein